MTFEENLISNSKKIDSDKMAYEALVGMVSFTFQYIQ